LKSSGAAKKELKTVSETVESEHPYPNGCKVTHRIAIEGATRYKLTFDERCSTEEAYDYLELFFDEE
jgi:hypothetical protein